MSRRERDSSIENEPHFQARHYQPDPSDYRAAWDHANPASASNEEELVAGNVWDEPTLSAELTADTTEDRFSYSNWLARKQAETSYAKSILTMLGVALVAGPWGILGAFIGNGEGAFSIALLVIFGPVTEEIMKVATALWIVEKKPFLFKSVFQILFCAAAGGAAFGFIENLVYLHIYIPDHSATLAVWRWSVCTGLHMNCSFVAGVGLARIWYNAMREHRPPEFRLGISWLVLAMVAHGTYNAFTVVAEAMGWLKF